MPQQIPKEVSRSATLMAQRNLKHRVVSPHCLYTAREPESSEDSINALGVHFCKGMRIPEKQLMIYHSWAVTKVNQ